MKLLEEYETSVSNDFAKLWLLYSRGGGAKQSAAAAVALPPFAAAPFDLALTPPLPFDLKKEAISADLLQTLLFSSLHYFS